MGVMQLNLCESLLLVIDIQERFRPHIHNAPQVIAQIKTMVQGATVLTVPVIVSEQYPEGLGQTVSEIKDVLPSETPVYSKMTFSCAQDPIIIEALKHSNRRQIILCGIEAHVCVNQTAMDLLALGFQVILLQDAISARNPEHVTLALQKLQHAGATVSCVEMALFELLHTAQHPQFKAIQALVK